MEHIYQNIQGWFTFPKFYSSIVEQSKDNYHIVEIGAWKGKSTAYMAVEIANSNKKIKFDCVDTWEGDDDIKNCHDEPLLKEPNLLYEHFLKNIEPVKQYINPIRKTSFEASKLFLNETLNCVFIDGSHDYDSVKSDILAWLPKIKNGGVLSGHDFSHQPIKKALKDTLGSGFFEFKNEDVWVFKVKKI